MFAEWSHYFCIVHHFGVELKKKENEKKTVNDPNILSAIRPVPHIEDLPVPVPPQHFILDSDDEPIENRKKTPQLSTSTDADFTADLQCN